VLNSPAAAVLGIPTAKESVSLMDLAGPK
jgi:hypothetical protein